MGLVEGRFMNLRVLFLLFLSTSLLGAEPATNIGPKGSWVTNGRWQLKVNEVRVADGSQEFEALPFSEKIAGNAGKAYQDQVERLVFGKGQRLLVVDLSLKNVGSGAQKIGFDTPSWIVRCNDGQESRTTGVICLGARDFFTQPLQKFGAVGPGKTVQGAMAFVLPANTSPKLLFFKTSRSMEKFSGKSESLVSRLAAPLTSTAKALVPQRPNAEWKQNGKWKMRLTDARLVKAPSSYRALPWGERLKGEELEKHLSYVERNVFAKGGSVLLLRLEAKNLSEGKAKIGYEVPFWQVVDASGKVQRLSGVYQKQIGWALVGGFPKNTRLNSNAVAVGHMGIFLPPGFDAKELTFQVPKSLEKVYGRSESLKFRIWRPGISSL